MADRTVAETVADGDQLSEGYFNGLLMNRKLFTLATETTTTSTSFEDVTNGAFTITTGLNALIVGFHIQAEVKDSNAGVNCTISMKVAGTNLGTVYLNSTALRLSENEGSIVVGTSEVGVIGDQTTSYAVKSNGAPLGLKLLDATTTFTTRFKTDANTGYIKNLQVTVLFVRGFNEE